MGHVFVFIFHIENTTFKQNEMLQQLKLFKVNKQKGKNPDLDKVV